MDKRTIAHKDTLTTEKIKKKFASQFDLVNFAIKRAEHMILSGRDSDIKSDIKNKAYLVIQEIDKGNLSAMENGEDLVVATVEIEVEEVKKSPKASGKKSTSKKA